MFKAKSNCIKDVSPIEAIVSEEIFEEAQKILENSDRVVFESVIEKMIIRGYNDEGEEDQVI